MLSKWLQRLRGGSSADTTEPVTAPEPATMPSEPDIAADVSDEAEEPAGDEPA
jgi:hypothetical protein